MIYKVLIADDEMLARYSLKTLISKNFDNISVAGEAENGRQAIEIARDIKPHIIFMDIKMPGINGLDASKEILKESPDTIIIILSAHDNFSYAQKALNDGVHSYLLKPFQKQDIIDKLSEKITFLENKEVQLPVQKELIPFLEEELIAFLIGDNKDRTIEHQIQSILNFEIKSGLFMLIKCAGIEDEEKRQAIRILKKKVKCLISQRTGADLAFFICCDSFNNRMEVLETLLTQYVTQIKRLFKRKITCGIGNPASEKKEIEQSFHQAYIALKNVKENHELMFYKDDYIIEQNISRQYPHELESKLLNKIQGRDFLNIEDIIDDIISTITGIQELTIVREFAAGFMNTLTGTARSMGVSEIKGIPQFPIQNLFSLQTSNEIKHYLKSTALQIKSTLQSEDGDSNWWLERAFLYMKKNLYSDISLDIIADEIKISPQHLSRIFKNKYAMTIGEYITDQRISYAKYLLCNSDLSIKDISSKIGYSDQNYFSRVFKKHTGKTPSNYKEST